MVKKVTYGKNVYDSREINAVIKQLHKSTQMGKSVELFEQKISNLFGKKYGIMVNSGSSAITIALRLLKLPKNSEIITPCLNFGTAISSILLNQCKPILVDINVKNLQIDVSKIQKSITKKTRAIMIPNLIGNIPDWIKINKIAKKNKIKIIEDSADTLGGKINNNPTGKYSDISITSFYGSHVISCAGNGGMLMLNNKNLQKKAKILRSWGRLSSIQKNSENINKRLSYILDGKNYDSKFIFSEIGYNFEPSELGASFGLVQLQKFKKFEKIRENNFNYHLKFFKKLSDFFLVPEVEKNIKTNHLAYPVILRKNKYFSRNKIQIHLEKNNIQTRPIFSGNIMRHPAFKELKDYNRKKNYPNSDYIMENGLLIGCHQGLNLSNLRYIHSVIKKFLKSVTTK